MFIDDRRPWPVFSRQKIHAPGFSLNVNRSDGFDPLGLLCTASARGTISVREGSCLIRDSQKSMLPTLTHDEPPSPNRISSLLLWSGLLWRNLPSSMREWSRTQSVHKCKLIIRGSV